MELLTAIIAVLIIGVVYYGVQLRRRYKDLPPGPYGLPLVGYVPFMGSKPYLTFKRLADKYGSVFSVTIGSELTVFVNDWKGIKEVLIRQGDTYSTRPYVFTFDVMFQGKKNDIVTTSGPITKEHKRFSVQLLKDFGFGKSVLEGVVLEKVNELVKRLEAQSGQAVDVTHMFLVPILNGIWGITSGNRFDSNDPKARAFGKAFHGLIGVGSVGILNVWPFLRHLAPKLTGYTLLHESSRDINNYMAEVVDGHWDNFKNNERRDFTDEYIAEIEQRKRDGRDQPPYTKTHVIGTIFDLFVAGVETVDTTMSWCMLLVATHPEVQRKIQRELDSIITNDSDVTSYSKSQLPYTEAAIMESQRMASIVPFNIPHATSKDTILNGYKIPKGTTVMPNLYALHHDEKYWGDPENFRPERFLDGDGKLIKHDCFLPFSAGPRVCLGESLAKLEMTLFFRCLFRRFDFEMIPGQPKPSLEPIMGLTLRPHPYKLIVRCREQA